MELVRHRVILQIRVGHDDKLTKKSFFFLRLKRVNYGYFTKEMARKTHTGQRWPFHHLLEL